MSLHVQPADPLNTAFATDEPGPYGRPRTFAYCVCGVVGPLRRSWSRAVRDEAAHFAVCSQRLAAA